jgi:pyruvate kinase
LTTPQGNDDSQVDRCGEVVNAEISSVADLREERIMCDPKATKATGDSSGVNLSNVDEVVMGDLSEKDQRDLELELHHKMEEEMVEQ